MVGSGRGVAVVDRRGEVACEGGWADGDRAFCRFSIAAILDLMSWISDSLAWMACSESTEGVADFARTVGT